MYDLLNQLVSLLRHLLLVRAQLLVDVIDQIQDLYLDLIYQYFCIAQLLANIVQQVSQLETADIIVLGCLPPVFLPVSLLRLADGIRVRLLGAWGFALSVRGVFLPRIGGARSWVQDIVHIGESILYEVLNELPNFNQLVVRVPFFMDLLCLALFAEHPQVLGILVAAAIDANLLDLMRVPLFRALRQDPLLVDKVQ